MAFLLRQSVRSLQSRATSTCRAHTCIRCQATVSTVEPCSFVSEVVQICPRCAGQELALAHLPAARSVWGSALARRPRR